MAALVVTAAAVSLPGCTQGPARLVVVLLLDTVRFDALGCYGHPNAPTPNIDAIAADGVRFEEAISTSGWTLPAVGSLLTGTWPTVHGGLGKSTRLTPIRDEIPTGPEVLEAHGFKTLAVANAAFVSPLLHLDRGFDVFDHQYTYNWDTRRADVSIDVAIDLLSKHRGHSRFLLVHLFDAHLDYDPPGAYASLYAEGRTKPPAPLTHDNCLSLQMGDDPPSDADIDYVKALYEGEIAFMDAQIGRFVEELKARDAYDDGTIIVIADHGEEFWEHRGFEHGHTLYDELVHIPLIVKLPSSVEVGTHTVAKQVRIVDIMPTIFDLLEIDSPPSFAGRSLMPLIRGESDADRAAFCESTLYGANRIAWRTDPYKYIIDVTGQSPDELYNWRNDPAETTNLLEVRPAAANDIRQGLDRFIEDMAETVRPMSMPAPVDMSPAQIDKLRSLGYIR